MSRSAFFPVIRHSRNSRHQRVEIVQGWEVVEAGILSTQHNDWRCWQFLLLSSGCPQRPRDAELCQRGVPHLHPHHHGLRSRLLVHFDSGINEQRVIAWTDGLPRCAALRTTPLSAVFWLEDSLFLDRSSCLQIFRAFKLTDSPFHCDILVEFVLKEQTRWSFQADGSSLALTFSLTDCFSHREVRPFPGVSRSSSRRCFAFELAVAQSRWQHADGFSS